MSGLRKDTSKLIECRLQDCIAKDRFITGTFGNQGTFRIAGYTILGDVLVKTELGEEKELKPDTKVWRHKRLAEILHNDNDIDIIGGPKATEASQEETPRTSRLVDVFKNDQDVDISAFF